MKRALFMLAFLGLLNTSCGNKQLYYMNGYSDSLYKFKINPNDTTLDQRITALKKIIDVSSKKSLKVAPGVYAEYGYLLFLANKGDMGRHYLILEKQTYPESTIFIDRLLEKYVDQNKVIETLPELVEDTKDELTGSAPVEPLHVQEEAK